jgi:hypothetical protein
VFWGVFTKEMGGFAIEMGDFTIKMGVLGCFYYRNG